jgi:hypothetical protein
LQHDVTCVYKLFNSLLNLDCDDFFTMSHNVARGHIYKLSKPYCKHSYAQNFFTYRVINIWNNLPVNDVTSKNPVTFKRELCTVNFLIFCKGRVFK